MSFPLRCADRVLSTTVLLAATGLLASVSLALTLPAPRLQIATPVESPVTLESVTILIEITGSLALTNVKMVFFNANRRQLEGELQFPLLDGQSIVGFALEVDGKLCDAVSVEKTHGRTVSEDITRQRIDPGLLQVTQGNNFKPWVYPILPGQPERVMIRYTETLPAKYRSS